jgi:hypothetical protein
MNWTEILAAGTVAIFVWSYLSANATGDTLVPPYARPIDDPVVQAKIAAAAANGPYRDYSDVVGMMERGEWYGGL